MFAYTGSTLATRASQGEKELHHILKGVGSRQQSDEAQVEARHSYPKGRFQGTQGPWTTCRELLCWSGR